MSQRGLPVRAKTRSQTWAMRRQKRTMRMLQTRGGGGVGVGQGGAGPRPNPQGCVPDEAGLGKPTRC